MTPRLAILLVNQHPLDNSFALTSRLFCRADGFLFDVPKGFTKRKMSSYGKSVHRPHKLSFMPKDTRKTKRGGGKAAAFDDADELRAPVAEEEDVEESGSEESTHEEEAEAAGGEVCCGAISALLSTHRRVIPRHFCAG
jgi:hypothetical protein